MYPRHPSCSQTLQVLSYNLFWWNLYRVRQGVSMSYPLAKVHVLQAAKKRQQIKGKHGGGPTNPAGYGNVESKILSFSC